MSIALWFHASMSFISKFDGINPPVAIPRIVYRMLDCYKHISWEFSERYLHTILSINLWFSIDWWMLVLLFWGAPNRMFSRIKIWCYWLVSRIHVSKSSTACVCEFHTRNHYFWKRKKPHWLCPMFFERIIQMFMLQISILIPNFFVHHNWVAIANTCSTLSANSSIWHTIKIADTSSSTVPTFTWR